MAEYKLNAKQGSILFILIGVGLGLYGGWEVKSGLATKSWPSVDGVITSSDVRSRRSTTGTGSDRRTKRTYEVDIDYQYTVHDELLFGHRVAYGIHKSSRSSAARRIARKYSSGDTVSVYYNPVNPKSAVLEPGARAVSYLMFGGGVLLVIIGLAARMGGEGSTAGGPSGRRKPLHNPGRQT